MGLYQDTKFDIGQNSNKDFFESSRILAPLKHF
jgi:hypothetical protein